ALDAIGIRVADGFSELPAVLALDRTDEGPQIARRALAHLGPVEQGREARMEHEEGLGQGVQIDGRHGAPPAARADRRLTASRPNTTLSSDAVVLEGSTARVQRRWRCAALFP